MVAGMLYRQAVLFFFFLCIAMGNFRVVHPVISIVSIKSELCCWYSEHWSLGRLELHLLIILCLTLIWMSFQCICASSWWEPVHWCGKYLKKISSKIVIHTFLSCMPHTCWGHDLTVPHSALPPPIWRLKCKASIKSGRISISCSRVMFTSCAASWHPAHWTMLMWMTIWRRVRLSAISLFSSPYAGTFPDGYHPNRGLNSIYSCIHFRSYRIWSRSHFWGASIGAISVACHASLSCLSSS